MPGFFIELLTLAEPDKLGSDGFSQLFGVYTGDFLKRSEGLSLLILESQDAGADAAAFHAGKIAASEKMRFDREGRRPDGTPVKVGFSLAFAQDETAQDIRFAVCQQHYPENFWNPAFWEHANGVEGIAGAVLVADEPARHRDFLLVFSGAPTASDTGDDFTIDLPRGAVDVLTPGAFTGRYDVAAPDMSRGLRLAALRFVTDAKKATQQPISTVLGAVLVFEPR
jgi:hypothetical protein